MKKIDKVLKQLSDLYEFNRRIQRYKIKKKEDIHKDTQRKKRVSGS